MVRGARNDAASDAPLGTLFKGGVFDFVFWQLYVLPCLVCAGHVSTCDVCTWSMANGHVRGGVTLHAMFELKVCV